MFMAIGLIVFLLIVVLMWVAIENMDFLDDDLDESEFQGGDAFNTPTTPQAPGDSVLHREHSFDPNRKTTPAEHWNARIN